VEFGYLKPGVRPPTYRIRRQNHRPISVVFNYLVMAGGTRPRPGALHNIYGEEGEHLGFTRIRKFVAYKQLHKLPKQDEFSPVWSAAWCRRKRPPTYLKRFTL
jgi:hypothetical protein